MEWALHHWAAGWRRDGGETGGRKEGFGRDVGGEDKGGRSGNGWEKVARGGLQMGRGDRQEKWIGLGDGRLQG